MGRGGGYGRLGEGGSSTGAARGMVVAGSAVDSGKGLVGDGRPAEGRLADDPSSKNFLLCHHHGLVQPLTMVNSYPSLVKTSTRSSCRLQF